MSSNVTPQQKEIINMLYETVVNLGFTFVYAMAGKKFLGITSPSTKMDSSDALKMVAYFTAGRGSREMAVSKGWIPSSIVPKPK